MEFKIDTKPSYAVITPVSNTLDANLTAAIRQKWNELAENGQGNVIIDLNNCVETDETAADGLTGLHEEIYSANHSIVFTNPQPGIMAFFKSKELDLLINLAPTMNEAVDIVSMEMLERDLFNEES